MNPFILQSIDIVNIQLALESFKKSKICWIWFSRVAPPSEGVVPQLHISSWLNRITASIGRPGIKKVEAKVILVSGDLIYLGKLNMFPKSRGPGRYLPEVQLSSSWSHLSSPHRHGTGFLLAAWNEIIVVNKLRQKLTCLLPGETRTQLSIKHQSCWSWSVGRTSCWYRQSGY